MLGWLPLTRRIRRLHLHLSENTQAQMQCHGLTSTQSILYFSCFLLHSFSCMSLKWNHSCLGWAAEPVGKSILWHPNIPFQPTVPLASLLAPNECPLKHLSGSFSSSALLFGGTKHKGREGLHSFPSHSLSMAMTLRSSVKP